MSRSTPITVRNARFQQWEALLTNRSKRHHRREFLVHGVRPITSAVRRAWPLHALLHPSERTLSQWAEELLREVAAVPRFALSGDLLRELGERSEHSTGESAEPELLAVAELPPDELDRIPISLDGTIKPADDQMSSPGSVRHPPGHDHHGTPADSPSHAPAQATGTEPDNPPPGSPGLVVAFDRPGSPGNLGTLIRSADAFGAAGVVVNGHAADPYDPKAVRSSTGSLFALPTVRVSSPGDVVDWARQRNLRVVGTDESGDQDIAAVDLTEPTLLVVGNETTGLSRRWLEYCDHVVGLPMPGARIASSLNAATAGSLALYEAARQRS